MKKILLELVVLSIVNAVLVTGLLLIQPPVKESISACVGVGIAIGDIWALYLIFGDIIGHHD